MGGFCSSRLVLMDEHKPVKASLKTEPGSAPAFINQPQRLRARTNQLVIYTSLG